MALMEESKPGKLTGKRRAKTETLARQKLAEVPSGAA